MTLLQNRQNLENNSTCSRPNPFFLRCIFQGGCGCTPPNRNWNEMCLINRVGSAAYKQTQARRINLTKRFLIILSESVILLSVSSVTLLCPIKDASSQIPLWFQANPEAMKRQPPRDWLNAESIIRYSYVHPAVGMNSTEGFTHAKFVSWNILSDSCEKRAARCLAFSSPNSAVMLLHKLVSLYRTQTRYAPFPKTHQHTGKHSHLQI